MNARLTSSYSHFLKVKQQQLDTLANSYIFKQPERLYEGYLQNVESLATNLRQSFRLQLGNQHRQLQTLAGRLMRQNPQGRVQNASDHLGNLQARLTQAVKNNVAHHHQAFNGLQRELANLDPTKVMKRGYSFVSTDGHIINGVDQVKAGQQVTLNFYNGQATAKIEKTEENKHGNTEE